MYWEETARSIKENWADTRGNWVAINILTTKAVDVCLVGRDGEDPKNSIASRARATTIVVLLWL